MGVWFRYQAIPARGRFFALLQKEKCFPLLLRDLFPHGNGVFDFLRTEPEAATRILEGTAERFPAVFGTGAPALQQVEMFCAEAGRACKECPGLESEVASLTQFPLLIEGRLEAAVLRDPARAGGWARKLIHGDQRLTPGRLRNVVNQCGEDSVRVVSLRVVRMAGKILPRVPPSALFEGKEQASGCSDEYRHWRRTLLEAAKRSHILLVREMTSTATDSTHPSCPYCGATLPTGRARQCFMCGMDWHDPANVVGR